MTQQQMPASMDHRSTTRRSMLSPLAKLGRGVVVAGALAVASVSTVPGTAHAGHPNTGAAIGLGILGGVIAGAAIAAATPPVYAAPPAYYSYPQPGYYYNSAPGYYYPPQTYYGSPGYGYAPYGYQ